MGGRSFSRLNPADVAKAREYLEQATQKDPGYVMAYAGLAYVFNYLSMDLVSRTEFAAKAEWAARKALELDPNLAEAHAQLGCQQAWNWDWHGSEREFLRSLELDPDSVIARTEYALFYLVPIGRIAEALEQSKWAVTMDPLSALQHRERGWILYLARDYEASNRALQTAREIDDRMFANLHLGKVMLQRGRFEEAARECQWPVRPDPVCVAMAYAGTGRAADAQAVMLKVQTDSQFRHRRGERIAEHGCLLHSGNHHILRRHMSVCAPGATRCHRT